MQKLFFRTALFGLGVFLAYIFGGSMAKTIGYRFVGTTVEGRVIGFVAGRGKGSVLEENTGVRKGKRRNRRPVFRFAAPGVGDSVTVRSNAAVMFAQYELNERIPVVFVKKQPQDAYIFGFQILFMQLLALILALYMIKIGLTGRL